MYLILAGRAGYAARREPTPNGAELRSKVSGAGLLACGSLPFRRLPIPTGDSGNVPEGYPFTVAQPLRIFTAFPIRPIWRPGNVNKLLKGQPFSSRRPFNIFRLSNNVKENTLIPTLLPQKLP